MIGLFTTFNSDPSSWQVNTSRSCDMCYIWHLRHVIQKEAQKLSKNELKTNVFVFSLQKGKGWPTESEEEPMLAWILEDTFPGQHSLIMVHDHLSLLYKSLWATNWKEMNPRPFMNKPRFVLLEIANDEDPKSVFEKTHSGINMWPHQQRNKLKVSTGSTLWRAVFVMRLTFIFMPVKSFYVYLPHLEFQGNFLFQGNLFASVVRKLFSSHRQFHFLIKSKIALE